ncbi:MAG: ATP-dependent helicase [Flavobacteriaceae bacterium]|nr:ATP-dependent helicase [Flavobacteriaceae bacterium]
MNPTPEQSTIINSTGDLCINAIAGSGKTTTILQYAATRPSNAKILYIAYNKSVKTEAQHKCKKLDLSNVRVETAHSLAYKHIIRKGNYSVNKRGYKTFDITQILELRATGDPFVNFLLANHIAKLANYFCNSTALKVQDLDYSTTLTDKKAKTFVKNHYQLIERGTREFLAKMENREIECTHDFYLKKFQLTNPVLNFDYILFDEGQDASPAMLDIFLKQKAAKIIVGDIHQQIYAWRFAVNSLNQVPFPNYNLTTSFRFPPAIANLANGILSWKKHIDEKHSPLLIKGIGKTTDNKISSKAIIARTNLGLLLKAIEYVVESKKAEKIYFEGNINSYTYAENGTSLYDVLNLYIGKRNLIKDSLIKTMHSIEQLENYIENTEDVQLAMMVKIVQEYGQKIPVILKEIKEKHISTDDKETAEVIFSTVHRSKGMEYDAVYLVNDFISEEKIKKLSKEFLKEHSAKINEEINLLYVAITRTKKHLFIPETLLPENTKKSPYIHPLKVEVPAKENGEITIEEVIGIMTKNSNPPNTNKKTKAYSVEEKRKSHKDAYKPWTPVLDDELTVLYCEGNSVKSMAVHFGRTQGAIRSRIKKLELKELYG